MKTILVTHPVIEQNQLTPYFSIGLYSLATNAKLSGFDLEVFDLNKLDTLSDFVANAASKIVSRNPDVVGLGSICNTYPITIQIAQKIKQLSPKTLIILGGPQAAATAEKTLKEFNFVDIIVRCEAEKIFPILLYKIENRMGYGTVEGLSYRENDEIFTTSIPNKPLELNDLPQIDYRLCKNLSEYGRINIEIGRGCPFSCHFCSTSQYWFRRYRVYDPAKILDHINKLIALGHNKFHFIHDNITYNRSWMETLCKFIIENNSKVDWTCSTRLDCLDKRLIDLMCEAGCTSLFTGIETGSDHFQKKINKRLDLDLVLPTVAMLKGKKIKVTTSFITGFPNEKKEDIQSTIDLILKLVCCDTPPNELQLHIISPLSDTVLLNKYKNHICYFENDIIRTFANTLDSESKIEIKKYPYIFSSYFGFKHPVFNRNFLTNLVLFVRTWCKFPFTSYVFWKHEQFGLIHSLFSRKEVLSEFEKINHTNDIILLLQCSMDTFFKIFNSVDNPPFWIRDIMNYEYAVNVVIQKERKQENPVILQAFCDIKALLSNFRNIPDHTWSLPNEPKYEKTTYLVWQKEGEIQHTKVSQSIAKILKDEKGNDFKLFDNPLRIENRGRAKLTVLNSSK